MKSFAIVVLLAALGAYPHPAWAHSLKGFEGRLLERERYVETVNVEPPAFTLSDSEGRPVSLSDFKVQVVVLYFVYARCKELCPLQNDFIAIIREQVNQTPLRDLVEFVTVATDTTEDEQETVEIMRGFPRRHGFDRRNWVFFYRGRLEPDATFELAQKNGVRFSYTNEANQIHGVVAYLIDTDGMLRARYHGLNFDPGNFISHVRALVNDRHKE